MPLSPLVFFPYLKKKSGVDGALAKARKAIPAGVPIGESWEISAVPGTNRSREAAYSGKRCRKYARKRPRGFWGIFRRLRVFPLLYKFIDANDRLSVQVHPDDERARSNRRALSGNRMLVYR